MTITAAKFVSRDGYRIEYQVDGGPEWIHIKGFDHPDREMVLAAIPNPDPHVPRKVTPDAVTKVQLVKQLRADGKIATLKSWKAGKTEADDDYVEFEYSNHFVCQSPGIRSILINVFGYSTAEELDTFFAEAGQR